MTNDRVLTLDTESETAGSAAGEPEARRGPWRPSRRTQRMLADAEAQASAAAQQYAVILTGVDAAKLDSNFAAVLDGASGEFKDMYSQSSAGLKQVLIDNKANATGTVIAAGIKSATSTRVEVMLFVDQAVTNALNPEPRLDRNRIIMTMDKVDGRWLAGDVELA